MCLCYSHRGGVSVFTARYKQGDAVDLIFSMRSTAEFKKAIADLPTEYPQGADGSVAPFPDRMMDRLDVVAVPGYYLADEPPAWYARNLQRPRKGQPR